MWRSLTTHEEHRWSLSAVSPHAGRHFGKTPVHLSTKKASIFFLSSPLAEPNVPAQNVCQPSWGFIFYLPPPPNSSTDHNSFIHDTFWKQDPFVLTDACSGAAAKAQLDIFWDCHTRLAVFFFFSFFTLLSDKQKIARLAQGRIIIFPQGDTMLNLFLVFGGKAIQDIEPPIKRRVRQIVVSVRSQSDGAQPGLRGLFVMLQLQKLNTIKYNNQQTWFCWDG